MTKNVICYFSGIFLLMFLLVSCSTKKDTTTVTDVVQLEELVPETLNISEFASDVEIIKLESNDSCLIGDISKIRLDKDHVYVMDLLTRSILIFNRIDGKFCAKLNKHGRGYGEYIDMTDFYVDNEANSLEIYDLARNRIYVYDLATLDFVTDFAVPLAVRFEKKDGLYYFDTTHMGNYINEEKTNSGVLAFDPKTETVVPLFNDKRPDRENRFFNITGFSTNENGGLFYSQAWDNTFYRIEDQVAEPIMQIDPGKLGIPKSVTEGSYEEQERFFQTNKGGYMLFRLASYTDNRAIVAFTDGTNPHRYMYYMRFGEKEILTDKIVADLLEGEPEINMSNSLVYEDLFLTVWGHDIELSSEAASFLDKQGVTENDNPIITLFKIRKAL